MNVVAHKSQQIARPLKVLIPLIQSELQQGNDAGHEHYRRAGEMLIEAKDQVPHGAWGKWLAKNFDMHATTARLYMRWARVQNEKPLLETAPSSLFELAGGTERRRQQSQSPQHQAFKRVLRDVARDDFIQERQVRDEEVRLHRELAEELIDIGFRALAVKLHPDRGGSKIAMARLNTVRDQLKQIAETRRFV